MEIFFVQFLSLPVHLKKSIYFCFEVISPSVWHTGPPSKLSKCVWLPCVRDAALGLDPHVGQYLKPLRGLHSTVQQVFTCLFKFKLDF